MQNNQTNTVKAVIFDAGGVIIDLPTPHIMAYCADILGVDTAKFAQAYFACCATDFQKGAITEKEMWHKIASTLNVKPPQKDVYWRAMAEEIFHPKKEMLQCVAQLHQKGYKTGFLTNTEPPIMDYFSNTDYVKYFDAVVYSCREGITKPDFRIYQIILNRLNVVPQEALFVDDVEENIIGAHAIGAKTILFENVKQFKIDLRTIIGKGVCEDK